MQVSSVLPAIIDRVTDVAIIHDKLCEFT